MGTNGFVNRRSPVQSWAPAPKPTQGTGGKKHQQLRGSARAVVEMFGAAFREELRAQSARQGARVHPLHWVLDVFAYEHPGLREAADGKPTPRRTVKALVETYWPYLRETDFASVRA